MFTAAISVSSGKCSGGFELVTVQLLAQCSLQSTLSYIDRTNFHYIKILSTCYAFSCLRAESGFCKEIRTELGKSLSYLRTPSYRREKLHCEKCSRSLKFCKIILLRVTSIIFTFLPHSSLLVWQPKHAKSSTTSFVFYILEPFFIEEFNAKCFP